MIEERTRQADSALYAAVATEIRGIKTQIERLADLLCADQRFAAEYLDQLQHFDLIVQHADENASVLDRLAAGQSVEDAVAPVRLTAIQDRLRAAITVE